MYLLCLAKARRKAHVRFCMYTILLSNSWSRSIWFTYDSRFTRVLTAGEMLALLPRGIYERCVVCLTYLPCQRDLINRRLTLILFDYILGAGYLYETWSSASSLRLTPQFTWKRICIRTAIIRNICSDCNDRTDVDSSSSLMMMGSDDMAIAYAIWNEAQLTRAR